MKDKKYVAFKEISLGRPTVYVGELVKGSPKTLAIQKCEFGYCHRSRISKEIDKYVIISERSARIIYHFSKEMEKQYRAVYDANIKQYRENIDNLFKIEEPKQTYNG